MFNYQIIKSPNFYTNDDIIKDIFTTISKKIDIKQEWTLNIVFVSDQEIKNLNKNYRDIDKVTDVLSFHYFNDFEWLKKDEIAWEIILSENKIKTQAIEFWLWEEKEFYKLIIHSILHILWYDHETDDDYKIMSSLENKIWGQIFEIKQKKW